MKEKKYTYLKLIIYEAHLLQKTEKIKNIFPYIISIQFNQNTEKLISPIKKANETFNISKSNFKYLIRNKDKKVLIRINCYTKAFFNIKKNFASGLIVLENLNNINNNEEYATVRGHHLRLYKSRTLQLVH